MELGQQADVECTRSHILLLSVVALKHWVCALGLGALNLGLLGSSAVCSIAPSVLEHTGKDQMCILANSTV
jgi:hypothetical protein